MALLRATITLGLAVTLALATVALAPTASANHGPFCRDIACCQAFERGVDLVACAACVTLIGSWDTHANLCRPL